MVASLDSAASSNAMQQLALAKKATQEALGMPGETGDKDIGAAMRTALDGIDSFNQAVQQVTTEIDQLSQAQATVYDAISLIGNLTGEITSEQRINLTFELQNQEGFDVINNRLDTLKKTQDTKEIAYQIQIAVDAFLRTRDEDHLNQLYDSFCFSVS